jgi:hypothetical protein
MAELLYYPVLVFLLILQMVIVRQLPLFNGTADLILLWLAVWGLHNKGNHVWIGAIFSALLMSFVSAVPWYAAFASYLFVALVSRYMNKHFWHNPLIALFLVVFFCSLVECIIQYAALTLTGASLGLNTSLKYVVVPSVFLNLILAFPMYVIVNDMARWVYPFEANK